MAFHLLNTVAGFDKKLNEIHVIKPTMLINYFFFLLKMYLSQRIQGILIFLSGLEWQNIVEKITQLPFVPFGSKWEQFVFLYIHLTFMRRNYM